MKNEKMQGTNDHAGNHDDKYIIKVNEHDVKMPEKEATGLEIKQQAIAQGVPIELNFILELEDEHGKGHVINNEETVHLKKGMVFTAIRNDDNS